MAITAGTVSVQSVGPDFAKLLATAVTGAVGPTTYQWYRDTTSGFTIGAGYLLAGKTALQLNDTGLIPNTTYYYKLVATDTGAGNATVTYPTATAVTAAPGFQQNQFQQATMLGMVDLRYNINTVAVQIDASQATPLQFGAAVKMVDSAGGIPKVVGITADTDEVYGYLNYDGKQQSFAAGALAEMSSGGNAIYLYAATAIGRGKQVTSNILTPGGVSQATASSGKAITGWAYDKATAPGQLIRIMLTCPSFKVA